MAFLYVENLNFTYPGENLPTLAGISLEVQKGEFMLLCGPSGCGKTTFLRQLKPQLQPRGQKDGSIVFNGAALDRIPEKDAAARIGLIMQNPESQIVTETVKHELAFGLECLGIHPELIAKRIAETVSYFGIEDIYNKKTSELSGGEKQLVSIAAIMTMRPELLLLDEPASQLDPIAARNLYEVLLRLNEELGITVILSEHRIDDVFSVADRVALMNEGRLICLEKPNRAAWFMAGSNEDKIKAMLPVPARIFNDISGLAKQFLPDLSGTAQKLVSLPVAPSNVREVKLWFEALAAELLFLPEEHSLPAKAQQPPETNVNTAVEIESLCFRFDRNSDDVIGNLSLKINRGEILSIVGGNGAGKTTLLRLICGIIKPYSGKIRLSNTNLKIAYLPQNPQSMFAFDSVLEDLIHIEGELSGGKRFLIRTGLKEENDLEISQKLKMIIDRLGLESIIKKHPFDLSFGELQRASLAMLLLKTPDVLLLDEPTKGVDTLSKKKTAELLKSLCAEGMAIVAVTHDIEFSAEYSQKCAMLFDGKILDVEPPEKFFSGNMCYTTVAHRIAGKVFPDAVTCEEVKNKWIECAIKS